MRSFSAALAFVLLSATGALAQDGAATELRTVTTGQCDGRSASLEIMRGDTARSGSVTTLLDGRRVQVRSPIADRILEVSGPMDVTISCTATDVTFQIEVAATDAGGGEPRILSRELTFGMPWPTPAA